MKYKIIKKIFVHVFLCLSFISQAQKINQERIDSLITLSSDYRYKLELEKVINNGYDIVRFSESINYERGILEGYKLIIDVLSKTGEYEKCIEYFEKIKQYENYLRKNPVAQFSFYLHQSEVYYFMGIPTQSAKFFKEAERAILREKNENIHDEGLYSLYTTSHFYSEDPDITYEFLQKAKKITEKQNYKSSDHFAKVLDKALVELLIGDYFLAKKQPDTAIDYYKGALGLSSSIGGHYLDGGVYNGFGTAYKDKKQYNKAIESYQKSLDIFSNYKSEEDIKTVYSNFIELYEQTGDSIKKNEYVALKGTLIENMEAKKIKGRDRSIISLVNEKELAIKKSDEKKRNTIIVISLVALTLLGISYFLFYKYKTRKDKIIEENKKSYVNHSLQIKMLNKEIQVFDSELKKRDEEKLTLHQKVNESFDEVLQMARNNDSHFWIRFQEVYPDFLMKMQHLNSELRLSELNYSAYVYLGFSTKEIAEYTFKSTKTIENYRYNLRKRLSLPPEENLTIWLQRYINNTTVES